MLTCSFINLTIENKHLVLENGNIVLNISLANEFALCLFSAY